MTTTIDHEEVISFLKQFYPPELFPSSSGSSSSDETYDSETPFVTLTYAQSLDGKIAGRGGKQIKLSGRESLHLTHALRELNDSILVGVGTVLADDPSLSARIPTLLPLDSQPRPIVLDTHLKTPTFCKLLENYSQGIMPQPIVCCSHDMVLDTWLELEEAGSDLRSLDLDDKGRLSIPSLLSLPSYLLGHSLMVEGGASVINSFLESNLVDLIVITIAPIFVGQGISAVKDSMMPPELEHLATRTFGKDTVVVARPKRSQDPAQISKWDIHTTAL